MSVKKTKAKNKISKSDEWERTDVGIYMLKLNHHSC